MALTPSELTLQIKSQGIKQAADDLKSLAEAAKSVDAETRSFVIAQAKLQEAQTKTKETTKQTSQAVIEQKRDYETWRMSSAQMFLQQKRDAEIWKMGIKQSTADAAESLKKYNQTTKEYAALWKEMDTQKLLEQTQQYRLYTMELKRNAEALKEAAKMEKAHGEALEMNKKFDAQRAAQITKSTSALQINSRGITDQELAMVKAHEQALKMNKAFDEKAKRLDDVNSKGSIWNNTLKSMAVAASAYIGVNFLKGIVEQADAWVMLEAKLKLATGSANNAKVVQQDLFDLAQKLRIPLEDAGKLYTRLADPMRKAGKDSKETMSVVSGLSLALKLGGATAQEASSAMLQFSQAMNSGRLNGGEFNSMAENAPLILKAIEAQLRRTGKWTDMTTESLKKMGSDGKIGVTLIAESVQAMEAEWSKQFDTLPLTVDGAITRIKNAWFKAMGEFGKEAGLGKSLTEALAIVEKMIPEIRDKLIQAFINVVKWVDRNKEGLAEMGRQVAGLIGQVLDLAGASANVTTGFSAVGFAIYSIRLGIAGVTDGVKLIGAAFMTIGSVIVKVLTSPFEFLFSTAEKLSTYIANSFTTLAAASKAAGFDDVAKGLRNASYESSKLADSARSMGESLTSFTNIGIDAAAGVLEDFKNGNTEVQKILNGTDDVTKAVEQRSKYEESADLKRNERLAKARELALANEKANKKAQADFEKAEQDKASAIEKSTIAIQQQIDKLAYLRKVGDDSKYTATQKDAVALEVQLEKYENRKLSRADAIRKSTLEYQIAQNKVLQGKELEVKMFEDAQAAEIKANEDYDKKLKNAQEELSRNEALVSSDEKRVEVLAKLAASRQYDIYLSAVKEGADIKEIARQKELYEVMKRNAEVVEFGVEKENALKQAEDAKKRLDDLFNTSKVDKWESSLTKGLKGISKGFVDLSKSLNLFGAKEEKIAQARRDNMTKNFGNFKEMSEQESKISEKEADYKIASYADIADAAKGFFSENSRGYKAMDAMSKVLHAAQLARDLQATASGIMAGAARMFGQSGWGGFAGIAAMGAVMVGLGYATGAFGSSGGGGATSAEVQKTQGTGTVLGDSEAKSDSLSKALDSLRKNFDKLYPVNVGMLNALKNIEKSMTGLTNIVYRTGITTDTMGIQQGTISKGSKLTDSLSNIPLPVTAILGGWIGVLGSKIAGLIGSLWGKTTQNIVDSGLSLGGSLSGLKQGQGINQYASVDVTKSSWFGLKKTTTNQVQQQAVSNDISSQIGMIFSGMQTALEEAGKALFGKSDDVTKALEALTLSTTKISLKGLTGQALSDALNAVISKGLDEMAGSAFKDFTKYQQVGEGLAATVLRVADNFATVNSIMSKMNLTIFQMSMSGIDASLKLSELMGGLEELKSAASSYYENFFTEEERNAKTMEALKEQFKAMNQELPTSIKAYRLLLEELSKTGDTEKVAQMLKLSDAFAALYKNSADSLDPLSAAKDAFEKISKDAERWLNIRSQAASLKDSIDSTLGNPKKDPAARIKKLWDAMSSDISPEQKLSLANELKDLIIDKYQVEKEGIQKLIDFGKQLRGYTDSLKLGNLSPLTTTQKLAEAQKQFQDTLNKAMGGDTTAQQALTGKADAYLQLAQTAYASSGAYTSIFENVTGALDALGLSSMSAEDKTLAIAQTQADELLKLRDYAAKMETLSDSYYKTNLSLLAEQTSALSKLYDKMGVFDGIATNLAALPAEIAANLSEIMGGNSSGDYITSLYNSLAGKSGDMIDKQGYDYWTNELNVYGKDWVNRSFLESVKVVTGGGVAGIQPRNDNTEVVAQLTAVKEELAAMRADAAKQTGDLIVATYDANSVNAATVVEGTTQSLQESVWAANTTPSLI